MGTIQKAIQISSSLAEMLTVAHVATKSAHHVLA